jgi:hypothetical protein
MLYVQINMKHLLATMAKDELIRLIQFSIETLP